MVETARTCPTCGRTLGPMATRCFYCGPRNAPDPASPAAAEAPAGAPATPPQAVATEAQPNTRCPICKNPIPAQEAPQFVCPMCQSRLECLYAAPLKVVPKARLSEICTFHPEVQAAARCRTCRKAVCETCAFRARMGVYCPDCASAPDEARRKDTTVKGVTSLICGVVGLLLFGVAFVGTAFCEEPKSAEALWMVLGSLALIAGLVSVGMGFTSRDPARGRSMIGLIGLIIGFLVLAIYALLVIAGAVAGDS
jgi:hypothetical protein